MGKVKGYGFTGKLLHVDLTRNILSDQPTPIEWAHDFIGGAGLAARILYPLLNEDTDPLGPGNPLLFLAGVFTGTPVPCSGRLAICARSPLTRLWGECNIGGYFGATLRHAGYDGILIKGAAKKPTLLTIRPEQAELHTADHLWTKGNFDSQKILKKDLSEKRMFSLTIGPAGENLVKFASIASEGGRAAGRMGLGAVMGSKHLKAIVTAGTGSVPIAKPDELRELTKSALKEMMEDFLPGNYRELGTAQAVGAAQEIGAMPNKYWTQGEFTTHDNISGSTMLETRLVGRDGCHRCPIQCGRIVEIPEGKYKLPRIPGPEYESIGTLGSLILVDDIDAVIYANYLCDDLGLDTISCGSSIAFAYYLMDLGKLTVKEVGMQLEWGDPEPMIALIPKIAQREAFGDILAEGTRYLGEKYNVADIAVHVKGLDVACWDPRALFGMATIYATSPRGGSHMDGDMYMVLQGQVQPELGIDADDPQTDEGIAEVAAKSQSWRQVYNSLILCQFPTFLVDEVVQFYNLVTGNQATQQDLMKIGDRIITIKRLINLKLGLTVKDDKLPSLLLKALETGGTRGLVPDIQRQLKEYYTYRKWDIKTGNPSKAKLVELRLEDLLE